MKKYKLNNTAYTEKELAKIAKEKGKESIVVPYQIKWIS